jgi:hypothetical protein
MDAELHALGERIFYILSKDLEREQAEKLSVELLEVIIDVKNDGCKDLLDTCTRYTELINKENRENMYSFRKGAMAVVKMLESKANYRLNYNKDQLILILRTK